MFRFLLYLIYYIVNVLFVGDLEEFAITIPFVVLILCGVISIRSSKLTFSDMYWFVIYLFFVIGPIQAFSGWCLESGPLTGYCFDFSVAFEAASYVFLSILIFSSFFWKQLANHDFSNKTLGSVPPIYFILAFLASLLGYLVLSGGPSVLFMSRTERSGVAGSDFGLLFYGVLCFSLYLFIISKGKSARDRVSIALLVAFLVICNPMNSPRFVFLASWFPIFMIIFRFSVDVKFFYVFVFFILVLVMPVFSLVSRFGFSEFTVADISFGSLFNIPYIDVFDLGLYVFDYVSLYGTGDGAVLLLFTFFIPRSLWAGKPELYSLEIGDYLVYMKYAGTSNLSMNFFIDFYYDFGYVLGLISMIVFALFMKYLVSAFSRLEYSPFLLVCLMGCLPIIFRGPFPAVAGLPFSMMIACVIFSLLSKRYVKNNG